ncbi:hypothetical protein Y1Q_0016410 [Alligator mississippiensis]|uniref:Uncharacterized protein n=1 Tax=Alligator mississippiensis TaxID=8496 RepID=A0A151N2H9_ALLMI|nr:hypothetical protein Y1Q_0016410 [Alligator mississippiensis]
METVLFLYLQICQRTDPEVALSEKQSFIEKNNPCKTPRGIDPNKEYAPETPTEPQPPIRLQKGKTARLLKVGKPAFLRTNDSRRYNAIHGKAEGDTIFLHENLNQELPVVLQRVLWPHCSSEDRLSRKDLLEFVPKLSQALLGLIRLVHSLRKEVDF